MATANSWWCPFCCYYHPVGEGCPGRKAARTKLEVEELAASHILTSPNGGQRQVTGVRWDLLPFEALEEVSKIIHYGANKHGAENWKQTDFEHSEQSPINHGLRHFSKATTYPSGSPERIRQLAKAATNALFQIWHEVNLQKKNGESG